MFKLCALYLFTFVFFPAIPLQAQSTEGVFTTLSQTSDITTSTFPLRKEYFSESWTTHSGLPVNHINQVYQTPDGFLWLATFIGLLRFDGVDFVEFNSGNTEDLPSSRILLIEKGIGNSFWITTEQGNLVEVENGDFRAFETFNSWQRYSVVPDTVSATTWIGSHDGLYRYERGNLSAVRRDLFEGQRISKLFQSSNRDLWVFTHSGKAYRFQDNEIDSEPDITEIRTTVTAVGEDQFGKIWIGGDRLGYIESNGYTDFQFNRFLPDKFAYVEPLILGFNLNDKKELIVSTQFGLIKPESDIAIVPDQPGYREYSSVPTIYGNSLTVCPDGSSWALSNNRIYKNGEFEFETEYGVETIFCDLEQNLWFTTFRNGLLRYRLSLFDNITFTHSDNNFFGIYKDSYDGIWIGKMFGEISRIDRSGNIERYDTPTGWSTTAAITELSDGSILIGNQHCKPENRLANGACSSFTYIEPLRNENVRSFYEDSKKNIWVGTINGLKILSLDESGEIVSDQEIPERPVLSFLETRNGEIWYATNGAGVVRNKNNSKTRFNTENGLSSDNIRALYEDDNGYIWAGSEDRGINRIDPDSQEIEIIRSSDGLYNDGIHKMLKDDSGRIWFSSNDGVFWVDFSHLEDFLSGRRNRIFSTAYTERDGMLNRETNGGFQTSGMRTEDGRLWFVTQKGVLIINPHEIEMTQPLPKVIIESAFAAGRYIRNQSGTIRIEPDQRSFSIRYNCPAFIAPERIRFRYKLEGYDSDWVDAGNRREAIYTNVPAGNFVFKVNAYYDSEDAEAVESSLAMAITPLFHESFWFPLTVWAFILLLLGGGYRMRMRHLIKKEVELENIIKERTEALRAEKKITEAQAEQLKILDKEKNRLFANISHEFRTPLTLTIGPLEDLRNEKYGPLTPRAIEQVDLGIRNARRLLRLVGQLLDLTRLENKKFNLNLKAGNLSRYLDALSTPFKQTAIRRGIHFNVCIPKKPVFAKFDPGHFDKIIANLLSNAFKFTPAGGSVTLQLQTVENEIVISITDTGSGIAREHLPRLFERFYQIQKSEMQPGSGIGLSLAKELTLLHAGTIDVKSELNTGSTFTVRLPGINNAEKNPEVEEHPGQDVQNIMPESGFSADEKNAFDPDAGTDIDIRKTILIADDHPEIRSYLKSHLLHEYNIEEASSGKEALNIIQSELPDLIISDIMMPDGDGFNLLKEIRMNPETDYIPVILLTARAEAEDRLRGLNIGANDYITKPFQVREILVRIDNIFMSQKRFMKKFLHESFQNGNGEIHHDRVDVKSSDQLFLDSVKNEIQDNLSNENFSVEELALKLNQSRSNLHRRLTKLTGETPSAMIRRMRLELGAQLLKQKAGTVSEVAYSTGFKSIAHFSRVFREQYKLSPTEFIDPES
jgi:signal transduction histidine kinase/DNA-binding response OmpR family regulator/ligand-binding sensor domain-containing protein